VIFCSVFFYQAVPPGPIIHVYELHRAVNFFKGFPQSYLTFKTFPWCTGHRWSDHTFWSYTIFKNAIQI